MKFVKGISLFFIYPLAMLGIGFYAGVQSMHFFYPGESDGQVIREESMTSTSAREEATSLEEEVQKVLEQRETQATQEQEELEVAEVSVAMETLSVDTQYVLHETDVEKGTVVETTSKLPDKYIGLNREQFLEAMEEYEAFPPLAEIERGFMDLEVLSFAREKVVVQMNYRYIQPSTSFYLAVCNNEVVVYLEDMETIYINTGIELATLPEVLQQELIQTIWVENEEELYHFLENYSS